MHFKIASLARKYHVSYHKNNTPHSVYRIDDVKTYYTLILQKVFIWIYESESEYYGLCDN